jgi:hypothetical protein
MLVKNQRRQGIGERPGFIGCRMQIEGINLLNDIAAAIHESPLQG